MVKNYVDMIRELREDNDLNQSDVAGYLKIHQQTYSNYERGARDLPLEHFIKLCKFYNVSADYILCFTKEPKKIFEVKHDEKL